MKIRSPRIVCLSANTSWYLYRFRSSLISEMVARGMLVYALCPEDKYSGELEALGARHQSLNLDAKGMSPRAEFLLLKEYVNIYRRHKPVAAFHFTIKPVIYGSWALRGSNTKVISTVTGLGTAELSLGMMRYPIGWALTQALKSSTHTFFQNSDDQSLFVSRNMVPRGRSSVVYGSGIPLEEFSQAPMQNDGKRRFLMISRLIRDKGVKEYLAAAKHLKGQFGDAVDFALVGPPAPGNRTRISEEEVMGLHQEKLIRYLGELDDVRPEIRRADCVVLPSYREGLSRSLIEACAIGRPVIASNVPGCRQLVNNYENGFLCEPRDYQSLVNCMIRIILMGHAQLSLFGEKSRGIVDPWCSVTKVNSEYLKWLD